MCLSKLQKSTSPARFPNPPIKQAFEKGHTLIVFLYLLPNSNRGLQLASNKVAVAGYIPDITINYFPLGSQATS